jgi:hypothetical protein
VWREAGGRGGAGAAAAGHHGLTTRASARVRTECAVIMVYANDVSHSEQGSASGLGPAPGSDHTGFNDERGGSRAGRPSRSMDCRQGQAPQVNVGPAGKWCPAAIADGSSKRLATAASPALSSAQHHWHDGHTRLADADGRGSAPGPPAARSDAAASSGQDSSRRGSPRQCVLGWLPSCSHRGGVHPCRMPVALELESHSVRRACVRVVAAHHRHSTIES